MLIFLAGTHNSCNGQKWQKRCIAVNLDRDAYLAFGVKKTPAGLIGAGGQMVDDAYDRVLLALKLVEYDYYHQ